MRAFVKLSIIIPTLNEEGSLGRILMSITDLAHEIIVVDGGSADKTAEIAQQYTPHVFSTGRGRGRQQHLGACYAVGDVLVFLHADTLPPQGSQTIIESTLSDREVVFGAFRLSIHPPTPGLNLIALVTNLRSRILKMPYGDQALFMRRSDYFRVGGFRDLPVMEDVDLVRRLNRMGRFKLTGDRVMTSARRWEKEGVCRTTLRNWSLLVRYLLGASPQKLHRSYDDIR
jgi:rSAM/selenodomain-associated transferase 2